MWTTVSCSCAFMINHNLVVVKSKYNFYLIFLEDALYMDTFWLYNKTINNRRNADEQRGVFHVVF